jgi:hypothetical protein
MLLLLLVMWFLGYVNFWPAATLAIAYVLFHDCSSHCSRRHAFCAIIGLCMIVTDWVSTRTPYFACLNCKQFRKQDMRHLCEKCWTAMEVESGKKW